MKLLVFLAITACLFLLSTQSSFSQVDKEPFPEISDEDLELLEEFLEQAQDLFEVERFGEAITYYDKVLAIDSTDIDALNGKALALDAIGKPEEAISYYDKVLAIGSSNIEALNGKALALYNIGKSEEAITYYDRVLAIDSIDDDALYGKALALESLGREAEAIPLLEKFLEENSPAFEFRERPGIVNQEGVEEIAESDQTLFVIVGVFIVILISIIAIDFIAGRRKTASYIGTATDKGSGIDNVMVKLDGTGYMTVFPDAKGKWEATFMGVPDGDNVASAKATDNAGNDKRTSVKFTVE